MNSYTLRAQEDIVPEQVFLQRRVIEIEKAMGRVAAHGAVPIAQPLDVLDRAREITNDMYRQVRVRPLSEAISGQLEWLDRAEERLQQDDGEPKVDFNRVVLDRRLLHDLERAWAAERN